MRILGRFVRTAGFFAQVGGDFSNLARFYPGFTRQNFSMAEVFSSLAGFFLGVAELLFTMAALAAQVAELFVRRAPFFSWLAVLGMMRLLGQRR